MNKFPDNFRHWVNCKSKNENNCVDCPAQFCSYGNVEKTFRVARFKWDIPLTDYQNYCLYQPAEMDRWSKEVARDPNTHHYIIKNYKTKSTI